MPLSSSAVPMATSSPATLLRRSAGRKSESRASTTQWFYIPCVLISIESNVGSASLVAACKLFVITDLSSPPLTSTLCDGYILLSRSLTIVDFIYLCSAKRGCGEGLSDVTAYVHGKLMLAAIVGGGPPEVTFPSVLASEPYANSLPIVVDDEGDGTEAVKDHPVYWFSLRQCG